MLGWLDSSDREDFFNKIDFYCLPSHEETFSISLVEAMSYSKPCISTKTIGPTEIDNGNDTIIFSALNNPESFALCMEKLINNTDLTAKASQKNHELSLNYSVEKVSDNIDIALRKIVNIAV